MPTHPIGHDVYLCYQEPAGSELAQVLSAGLTRRGFRVVNSGRTGGPESDAGRLALIEETPDFVVLLTPGCLDEGVDSRNRLRAEVAHALEADTNIVPVFVPGFARWPSTALPPDLAALVGHEGVPFDAGAPGESIARIAHMLSSDTTIDERRTMREAKWITWTVGLALLAIVVISIAEAIPRMLARPVEPPPLAPLALYWSGFGQRLVDGRWVEFAVQDAAEVAGGDQVRLAFSLNNDGYAYVLSRDLSGDVSVLFPALAVNAQAGVRAGEVHAAPVDTGWLAVNAQTGLHTLYIVASYDPIENLESMVEEREDSSTPTARLTMLDATIAGLLDGRHVSAGLGVRTRRGRLIVRNLAVDPPVRTASATMASGLHVTHELTPQPGLVSALAEIPVRFMTAR